jgi:BirA family biotin operon repressor/biotin-[acetyl-CoA-carboxylase] ligase
MKKDLPAGTIAVADFQDKGRGRKQRKWEAPAGESLLFSILLKKNIDQLAPHIYTFMSGVAVCECLENYSPDLEPKLKWPNDVLIGTRKVCGILVETKTRDSRFQKVVIGIGLNVNQDSADFQKEELRFGGSLKMATGTKYNRGRVLACLLKYFDRNLDLTFKQGEQVVMDKWRTYCPYIGKEITISTEKEAISGIFQDIASDGALILKFENKREKFYAGDVSFDKRSI